MRGVAKITPKDSASQSKDKDALAFKTRSRLIEKQKKLLNRESQNYVDDPDVHRLRLHSSIRVDYWQYLVNFQKREKAVPEGHKSWMRRDKQFGDIDYHIPPSVIRPLKFMVHHYWDYSYISLFLLFLLVVVLEEHKALSLLPKNQLSTILQLILLAMCGTQMIPFLGTLFYIHFLNDVVHYYCHRHEFGRWAVVSVLLAQYTEHFFYSGQGLQEKAGHWRRSYNNENNDEEESSPKSFLAYYCSRLFKCRRSKGLESSVDVAEGDAAEGFKDDDFAAGTGGSHGENARNDVDNGNYFDTGGTVNQGNQSITSAGGDQVMSVPIDIEAGVTASSTQQKLASTSNQEGKVLSRLASTMSLFSTKVFTAKDKPVINNRDRGNGDRVAVNDGYSNDDENVLDHLNRLQNLEGGTAIFTVENEIERNESGPSKRQAPAGKKDRKSSRFKGRRGSDVNYIDEGEQQGVGVGADEFDDDSIDGEEEKDNIQWDSTMPSTGKSYLAQILAQRHAEAEERKRLEELAKLKEIAAIKEWTEFTCIVCGLDNRVPTHPKKGGDVYFDKSGIYYQRTVALVRVIRDVPRCAKCFTYMDYKPQVGSAHLFPYFSGRFHAFSTYPFEAPVQSKLARNIFIRTYKSIVACFYGLSDNSQSRLAYRDWRLKLFVQSQFPDIPRAVKRTEEWYELGEFVECKLQRSDWTLAKIIAVRRNRTYDIQYERGDELRLVEEPFLRLPPRKSNDTLRVEFSISLVILTFPLFLLVEMEGNLAQGQRYVVFVGVLIFAVVILVLRVVRFVMYSHQYYAAGLLITLRLLGLSILPLFLLIVSSAPTVVNYSGYRGVAAAWIVTKVISLPYLYAMKPGFALLAAPFFLQTSIGFILLSVCLDNAAIGVTTPLYGILIPTATASLTLIYYRKIWHKVWNVCLTSRKNEETNAAGEAHNASGEFWTFLRNKLRS